MTYITTVHHSMSSLHDPLRPHFEPEDAAQDDTREVTLTDYYPMDLENHEVPFWCYLGICGKATFGPETPFALAEGYTLADIQEVTLRCHRLNDSSWSANCNIESKKLGQPKRIDQYRSKCPDEPWKQLAVFWTTLVCGPADPVWDVQDREFKVTFLPKINKGKVEIYDTLGRFVVKKIGDL